MYKLNQRESTFFRRIACSPAYVCLFRRHFPTGEDIAALWMEQSGICHRFVEAGGLGSLPPSPSCNVPTEQSEVLLNEVFPVEEFRGFMEKVVDIGVLSLPHEMPSATSSHIENICLIKTDDGREHYFSAKDGIFAFEGAEQFVEMMTSLGLTEFYWKRRFGDRPRPLSAR